MSLIIRKMIERDIKSVQYVAEESWHDTYHHIIPLEIQQKFISNAYSEPMLLRRMKYSLMLVAEKDKEIVGFANFSYVNDQHESELSAIYLLPKYQGKGIGSALLNSGCHQLKNSKKIYVNVEKANKMGIQFYEKKGFEKLSSFEENLLGHVLHTVRMVLELNK